MGACASKSMALKEGEGAPVTPEEPLGISRTGEAEQMQAEEKQIEDAAEESEVAGGRDDGESNRQSLGVLMSEIEHPTTTTEHANSVAKVETREEDQPKTVDPVEKSTAIAVAEQSVEKVEPETEALVAELSTTEKEQPEQDHSICKVELNASPSQIFQDEVEEQSVDLAVDSAEIAEQCAEKVESGSAVAEISNTVMEQSEQDQFVEKAEVNASAFQISHEEEEQSKAVDFVVKSAVAAKQPEDKVESVSDTEISETSKTLMEQSEQDRFVEKAEVNVSAFQISREEEEQSKAVDFVVKSAVAPKQPEDKVESVSDTEIAETSKTVMEQSAQDRFEEKAENVLASEISSEEEEHSNAVISVAMSAVAAKQPVDKVESVSDTEAVVAVDEQALQKIEQKEGGWSIAAGPANKFESRTESLTSEISNTALQQPLKMTELEGEEPQISQKQALLPEELEVEYLVEKLEPEDAKPAAEKIQSLVE